MIVFKAWNFIFYCTNAPADASTIVVMHNRTSAVDRQNGSEHEQEVDYGARPWRHAGFPCGEITEHSKQWLDH